ncbi:MAG TPA: DUF1015 domain-containing protein [Candidatus Dormibacteraeota bacterium]|jgi:uncharacterized protein (DUF1015 family)
MANVRPFRGIRYDPDRVDLSQVVAPPYDIITPDDQQRYYRQDPKNVVRLIAGEVRASDHPGDNKYTRAAGFFQEWRNTGVLHQEPEAGGYVYGHIFVDPLTGERRSRVGLLCVVELEPFGNGILAHERTHARAKADRLSLTRAVGANLSPVFALFQDAESSVRRLVEPVMRQSPRLSITSDGGEEHRVWPLPADDRFREIARVLAASRLYMADGHHRYETALNFRNRQRVEHPEAGPDAAFNFVLMLLVDVGDPGLVILPTHRLLRDLDGFDGPALLQRLAASQPVVTRADRESLLAAMRGQEGRHRVGIALPGRRQATVDLPEPPDVGDPVARLDVSVLHREIFEKQLGLEERVLDEERYLSYWRNTDFVLDQAASGQAQAAFLLRPPAVSDVVAVAEAGKVMPQKSTYFYPKPLSGIVFNPLDPKTRVPAA